MDTRRIGINCVVAADGPRVGRCLYGTATQQVVVVDGHPFKLVKLDEPFPEALLRHGKIPASDLERRWILIRVVPGKNEWPGSEIIRVQVMLIPLPWEESGRIDEARARDLGRQACFTEERLRSLEAEESRSSRGHGSGDR